MKKLKRGIVSKIIYIQRERTKENREESNKKEGNEIGNKNEKKFRQ